MTLIALDRAPVSAGPLAELYRREPLFTATGLFFLLLVVPTAFAAALDTRSLADAPVWTKPLKFEVAIVIYLLSLAFFAKWLPAGTRDKRWYRIYSVAIAAGLLAEIAWIIASAGIGVGSHFNEATWGLVYMAMGVTAIMFTIASPVFGFQIWRNPSTGLSPALKASIVHGLVLTGVMTILVAGYMGEAGTHLIGGNMSDAEALPILGWATDGGDLRVPHMFATHAMHAIPVFGLVSARLLGSGRVLPVGLFSLAYAALVALVFAQAVAGLPLIAL